MSKKLNVIVLCGGFGTRLKSSIGNLPKILAPINGIPFINYFLKWLNPILSIKDVQLTFSVFYNFKSILNYIEEYDINCNFVIDSQPYGTFGASCKAALEHPADNYLILNGDTIFFADLVFIHKLFLENTELPFLILKKIDKNNRYGGYSLDQGKFIFSENDAGNISLGAYFISNSELFRRWRLSTKSELTYQNIKEFKEFPLMNDQDCLGLEPINGVSLEPNVPFIDIGIKDSFLSAQQEIPSIIESYNNSKKKM